MRRGFWIPTVLVAFVAAAPARAEQWTTVDLGSNGTGIRLEISAAGERVVVELAEARLGKLSIDGRPWAVVEAPEAVNLMERGRPSLPFLTTEYLLQATGGIQLKLESSDELTLDLSTLGYAGVAPSKGHFERTIDPETVPWVFDAEIYAGSKPFPAEAAWVAEPFIAGPLRGQALRIPVARWDPTTNSLHLLRRAVFRAIPLATAANPRSRSEGPLTAPFADHLRKHTLNPERALDRSQRFAETGRLAILAAAELMDAIQPLADWQTLVGYPTIVASTADVGSDATSVKAWLQSLYDSADGLTWVILAGDYPQIGNPAGTFEGARCDPCYATLEGTDNRPDVAISRLSASTPAELTVQVAKILDYEQNPDTGSAAAWYGTAFGIASSEGSPTDWQRMNELRDLLLPYGYSEFTELYDGVQNPGPAEVAAAVNQGRGLGLYIGHGSETAWVSSGFSASDVNSRLTNDGLLPVIWDVACVNGAFHRTAGDCFAEAWMKKAGGGAVSFEAATTNESWVPPCVAQRTIVDAVVEETAFTAGAQHLAAKLHLLDTYGDDSEGTKWSEQSHLFGACTLWPRTAPPLLPEEPTDFTVTTGVASLTVMVGGQPLTVPGRAVVSFLTEQDGVWTLLGSGLIGADGRVAAAVAGEPTHCHIHGRDLVPRLFELAARPEGNIRLDAATYSCSGTAVLRVADSNVPGSSPAVVDRLDAQLSVGSDEIVVELVETAADSGFYQAAVNLASSFTPSHGEPVVASYHDADPLAVVSANATVDCIGPTISGVELTASSDSLQLRFSTDEPASSQLRFGTSAPLSGLVEDSALVSGERVLDIDGVSSCTDYLVEVTAVDGAGNATVDDHGGSYWTVTSAGWTSLLDEPFDSDPGWTVINGASAQGWQFGQPQGGGGEYGGPDPSSGASGDFVYGVNLAGDYGNNLAADQLQLITPALDCSAATAVQLSFQRWLGVEQPSYDHARIQVSAAGGPWTTLWENQTEIADSGWTPVTLDLTALAAGQSDVRIRWTLGTTDTSWTYCGWNLDDVLIEAEVACTAPPEDLFSSDFEQGNCDAWSSVTP